MMELIPATENVYTSSASSGRWGGIDKFAARLLMVSFLLPQTAQVIATVSMGLYFVIRSVCLKEPIPSRNYIWALAIGSFYLLNLFAIPLTPPAYRHFLGLLCQRRVSILLMPFAFAIIAPYFRELIMRQILYFVYGCLVVCIVYNADFLYHYFFAHGGMHMLSHVQYRVMFELFTGIHPTYMGMFLSFAVCIIMLLYPANDRKGLVMKYGLVYLLLVFLLCLLAKSPLIALIIIGIHFAYKQRKNLYKYKMLIAGLLVLVAAACFFIPFIGQRINEIIQFSGADKAGNVSNNSVYVRQMIWHTETDLLTQHWLAGVGPGRMLHMLQERYFFYSIAHNFPVGYFDPHDQYISDWLSFGILGIVLLLAVMAIHFVKAIRTKNYLYLYLLIICSVTFFTETVLSRQKGVLFYAIFTSLFFFYSQTSTNKK